jgi:dihydroorotate dehydrogenase
MLIKYTILNEVAQKLLDVAISGLFIVNTTKKSLKIN